MGIYLKTRAWSLNLKPTKIDYMDFFFFAITCGYCSNIQNYKSFNINSPLSKKNIRATGGSEILASGDMAIITRWSARQKAVVVASTLVAIPSLKMNPTLPEETYSLRSLYLNPIILQIQQLQARLFTGFLAFFHFLNAVSFWRPSVLLWVPSKMDTFPGQSWGFLRWPGLMASWGFWFWCFYGLTVWRSFYSFVFHLPQFVLATGSLLRR